MYAKAPYDQRDVRKCEDKCFKCQSTKHWEYDYTYLYWNEDKGRKEEIDLFTCKNRIPDRDNPNDFEPSVCGEEVAK